MTYREKGYSGWLVAFALLFGCCLGGLGLMFLSFLSILLVPNG